MHLNIAYSEVASHSALKYTISALAWDAPEGRPRLVYFQLPQNVTHEH
jgi:hypothetical protein